MSLPAVKIENVHKTYRNNVEAVKGISLDVNQGDFFALLGPNGAGKSTLIGLITTLVKKTAGNISVFGVDQDKDPTLAKSLIGVVPQEFNFNIFEKVFNIVVTQAGYYGVPFKEATQRAEEYLTKLDLWGKKDTQAMRLSGGMKRRLMIARALVHRPRLLILDEPTAGVDIELRRTMWDFIIELNKSGTTIILTTHYLEEAENLCKNIAIINHGEIIINTTMKSLLQQMDNQTIVFELKESVQESLTLGNYTVKHVDSETIEVTVSKKNDLNHLFRIMNECDVKVLNMRNKSNRLEELFVKLVEK
jgi:ABC-2 type transport system ATP-binding protein